MRYTNKKPMRNEDGIKQKKVYVANKKHKASIVFYPLLLINALLILLAFSKAPDAIFIFITTFIVLISLNHHFSEGFSKNNYKKLAGAFDANGNHQCIYCGNRGIYRHTPYKTNNTLADCSKCGENLWNRD